MCLSLDYKTGERLMIDGLQRISSIIYFLTDKKWKLSNRGDRAAEKTVWLISQFTKEKMKCVYGLESVFGQL